MEVILRSRPQVAELSWTQSGGRQALLSELHEETPIRLNPHPLPPTTMDKLALHPSLKVRQKTAGREFLSLLEG